MTERHNKGAKKILKKSNYTIILPPRRNGGISSLNRVVRRNGRFPVSSALNYLDFGLKAFSCPLTYAGYNGRRILLTAPADIICRILLISFWIVLHLSLSGTPSLVLFLLFLTFGPGLRAWPDCWASVEFLHAPISRKGSGSTTTNKWQVISRGGRSSGFSQYLDLSNQCR